jgi:hypothetical protein
MRGSSPPPTMTQYEAQPAEESNAGRSRKRQWDGFSPQYGPIAPTMKTVAVVFALALITIAFGAYSDHILTSDHIPTSDSPNLAAALQHK